MLLSTILYGKQDEVKACNQAITCWEWERQQRVRTGVAMTPSSNIIPEEENDNRAHHMDDDALHQHLHHFLPRPSHRTTDLGGATKLQQGNIRLDSESMHNLHKGIRKNQKEWLIIVQVRVIPHTEVRKKHYTK
jgi:hypothetical protein